MNNNDSPLIPQGSFLEQKNKGRARVRIAVFVVLAIHGIGLLALLMQGCKPNVPPPAEETQYPDTNTVVPPSFEPTNLPTVVETEPPIVAETNPPLTPSEPVTLTPSVTAPPTAATEYKIAKGDTLSGLAKKFGVSLKAIMDANPGVDPTRLRTGQSINIPPAAPQPASPAAAPATDGMQIYTVRSGDSLIKLSGQFGVSVKAIRAANNLTTDRIRVGQKLKIPARPVAPAFSAPGSTGTATTNPGSGTTP